MNGINLKPETYHGEDPKGVHGQDGPIIVSQGSYTSQRIDQEFIAAAKKVGWAEVPDVQDLESINAVSKMRRFISPEGKRQDAASCYLRPRLNSEKYPNLLVLVETQVLRILVDKETKRAMGVEFKANPKFQSGEAEQPLHVVRARKLVIASSGACGTPSLLERSGLGDSKILERAGVSVVVDLPGVGNGYEDHHLVRHSFTSSSPCKVLTSVQFPPTLDTDQHYIFSSKSGGGQSLVTIHACSSSKVLK